MVYDAGVTSQSRNISLRRATLRVCSAEGITFQFLKHIKHHNMFKTLQQLRLICGENFTLKILSYRLQRKRSVLVCYHAVFVTQDLGQCPSVFTWIPFAAGRGNQKMHATI